MKEVFSLVGSLLGLILVLVATYYGTRWLAKNHTMVNKSRYMKVVDRVALGANKSICIVEINSRYYVMSVTDNDISVIQELEDFVHIDEEAPDFYSTLVKFTPDIITDRLQNRKVEIKDDEKN